MRTVASTPLLSFDGEEFLHADAVLLGLLDGRWQALERRVAAGLALELSGPPPDSDELAAAVIAWRRRQRLLAGEDLRAWLAASAIDGVALSGCVRRGLLRERAADDGRAALRDQPPGRAAVAVLLRVEATCDGTLADCAQALVDRLAARRALGAVADRGPGARRPAGPHPQLVRALMAAAAAGPDRGLGGLGAARLLDRARLVLSLDAAHRQLVATVATPERLERGLRMRRLDLTKVRLEQIELRSDGAAREAALCLRADGLALSQVAVRAGAATEVLEVEVGSVTGGLRAGLTASQAGDVVGPVAAIGGAAWTVAQVRERRPPSIADVAVRRALTHEIADGLLRRHAAGRVQWHGGS